MADTHDEIKAALEDARRAREEADRLRREAKVEADRLKDEARRARDEARRLRDQARNERRSPRGFTPGFAPPGAPPPGTPHAHGRHRSEQDDSAGAVRTEQNLAFEGVRRVQIDQTAGKLTVRPCKEGETPGIVSSGNKAAPEISASRDGALRARHSPHPGPDESAAERLRRQPAAHPCRRHVRR